MAGPTDIWIINASIEQRDDLIDMLFDRNIQGPDIPRTYREEARIKNQFISKKKVRCRKALR